MNRQEIFEYILGNQDWKTMHELSIQAFNRATELLNNDTDPPLQLINEAVEILKVYGWFVEAELTDVPPWGELDWNKLVALAPWKEHGIKFPTQEPKRTDIPFEAHEEKQLSMF